MKLKVKKDAALPTKPKLRVYAVVGMPGTKSTAMRRFSRIGESNLLGKYSISQVRPCAILLDAAGGVHNPLLREGGQVSGGSCGEAKLVEQPKPEEERLVGAPHY